MRALINLFFIITFVYSIPFIYQLTLRIDKRMLEFFRKKVLKDKNKRNGSGN